MKLLLINGPFAIGKSTVARALHERMPMSLLLEIDHLRRLYSRYRDSPDESLRLTEAMGRAMAVVALKHGHDVIAEGIKIDGRVLDLWLDTARQFGARSYEVMLWAEKDTALERADRRGYRPGSLLTREHVCSFWDALNELKAKRAALWEITTAGRTPEQVVAEIVDRLSL